MVRVPNWQKEFQTYDVITFATLAVEYVLNPVGICVGIDIHFNVYDAQSREDY